MKIGICGTHRTGKTTLAKKLSEKLGIPFVPSNVADIFKSLGLDPHEQYDFKTTMDNQRSILNHCLEKWIKHSDVSFVTDRTPIDLIGYMMCVNYKALPCLDASEYIRYIEYCSKMRHLLFDNIICLQPGITLSDDQTEDITCHREKVQANIIDVCIKDTEHLLIIDQTNISLKKRVKKCINFLATNP